MYKRQFWIRIPKSGDIGYVYMLVHVLWFVAGLARVQAFWIRIPKSGDIGYVYMLVRS